MKKIHRVFFVAVMLILSANTQAQTVVRQLSNSDVPVNSSKYTVGVEAKIFSFNKPISDLGNKIKQFSNSQSQGENYDAKKALNFFSTSGGEKLMGQYFISDMNVGPSQFEKWTYYSVPMSKVSTEGESRTTTLTSEERKSGYAFGIVANYAIDGRSVELRTSFYQLVRSDEESVSPFYVDSVGQGKPGNIIPMFWSNGGTQYGLFLTVGDIKKLN